jgi:hypothetical protein
MALKKEGRTTFWLSLVTINHFQPKLKLNFKPEYEISAYNYANAVPKIINTC